MWELGTVGIEIHDLDRGGVEAEVYFSQPIQQDVEAVVKGDRIVQGADLIASEDLQPQDWMETYRRQARPFALGKRFFVDPGEPEPGESEGVPDAGVMRIPARSAFGTGTHPSTSLVVHFLETMDLKDNRILDVGTGTGILTLVAMRLGAEAVVALDLDPVAAITAHENGRLNSSSIIVVAGRIGAIGAEKRFDLALVNILPSHIESDLENLRGLLVSSGEVIFSGILVEYEEQTRETLEAIGFELLERRAEDDWCALRAGLPDQ
jgi:ribosomal protein L11 methyltransferase